ncbi:hypothetical protein [Dactylosporangium sp. NPDC049140]|uniref:hypothetical protein n=1 Tax=Dactylosporangium sp. NPDC049140 TaxID=3155647 RepID=UPI0033F817F0
MSPSATSSRSVSTTWRGCNPGQQYGEVAEAWLDLGARLVVVTPGADGAWGYTRYRATRIDAVAVDVIDTTVLAVRVLA